MAQTPLLKCVCERVFYRRYLLTSCGFSLIQRAGKTTKEMREKNHLDCFKRREEKRNQERRTLYCPLIIIYFVSASTCSPSPRLHGPQFGETRDISDIFYFPPRNLNLGSAAGSDRCLICCHNNAPQQARSAQRTISFTHMFILYLRAILR